MGTAIVLKNADFSEKNLGKVTFYQPEKLQSISIIGTELIENTIQSASYKVEYNPKNTDQLSIEWEIIEGSDLATIDQNGVLVLNNTDTNGIIVIKATSLDNSSIFATKTIEVNRDVYNLADHLVWHEQAYWYPSSPYLRNKETSPSDANTKNFCTFDFVSRDLGNFAIILKKGWQIRVMVSNEEHPLNGGIQRSNNIRTDMISSSDEILYSFSNSFAYSHWTVNINKVESTAITLDEAKQAIKFVLIK